MKSREERGFEAAELRQASRGIGCKESVSKARAATEPRRGQPRRNLSNRTSPFGRLSSTIVVLYVEAVILQN